MKTRKSSKGMWVMLGVGGLIAVAGVIALLLFAFADDSSAPRRKKASPVPVDQTQVAPAPDPAPTQEASPPPQEKPRPKKAEKAAPADDSAAPAEAAPAEAAPAEKPKPASKKAAAEEAAPAPAKKVASGKVLGTLTLNPGPNVPVVFGGSAMPKQVGAFNLPVTAESGTIDVGDDSTQFKVSLEYAVAGGAITFKVKSEPWAIASVNGTSKGKTPVADVKVEKTMTVLELKKPGSDAGMPLRLLFKSN